MSSPLPVRVVNSAAKAIVEAARWWRTNRADSPELFAIDLENGFRLISAHPGIGALALNAKLDGVRRVHLARVHYHIYYRVTTEPAIEVLALWHTSRGSAPKL